MKEEETKEEDEKGSAEHSIDPVMQKYMEMVQAQKDKEKEVKVLQSNLPSAVPAF